MQRLLLLILLVSGLMTTSCNSSKATAQTTPKTNTEATAARPAGQQGARQGRPGLDLDAMATQLGLDAAQTVKFKEISERYATQAREMRQSAGGDRQAMRSKMEALRANQEKEMSAILTAEQQAAYAKIQEEMEAQRRNRGGQGGRPGGGRPGGGR
jgi:hypothetical protein